LTHSFIIEVASNHAGDSSRLPIYHNIAQRLDVAIKYQIFSPTSLCHHSYPYFKDLLDVYIPYSAWSHFLDSVLPSSQRIWLEPFDTESFDFCLAYAKHVHIKIPSCDVPMVDCSRLTSFRSVGFAVGGLHLNEINQALSNAEEYNISPVLFYGFQTFPTDAAFINFHRLNHILISTALPVIYADHTPVSNSPSPAEVCTHALTLGCAGIERHIILHQHDKYDTVSASSPDELGTLKHYLTNTSVSHSLELQIDPFSPTGSPLALSCAELDYRSLMQKKVVLARSVLALCQLTLDDVVFKRAHQSSGILAIDFLNLIQSKTVTVVAGLSADTVIEYEHISVI